MKYILVSVIMVACFAFGGTRSTSASTVGDGDAGIACGYAVCAKGTHCCNASCSRCVPTGMECTQESCD